MLSKGDIAKFNSIDGDYIVKIERVLQERYRYSVSVLPGEVKQFPDYWLREAYDNQLTALSPIELLVAASHD